MDVGIYENIICSDQSLRIKAIRVLVDKYRVCAGTSIRGRVITSYSYAYRITIATRCNCYYSYILYKKDYNFYELPQNA